MSLTTNSTQITPNVHRLCVAPSSHFEFAQFLITGERPCLVHAGKSSLFEPLKEMVTDILKGANLSYIVFSHVEADESGACNKWLELFPQAQVVCNKISNISFDDHLIRAAKILKDGDQLQLGNELTLTMVETPHFPHNWDAHMWFEEKNKVLFTSDFCSQGGVNKALVQNDISTQIIDFYTKGNFIPYGQTTNLSLNKIERFPFKIIAPMHGSSIEMQPTSPIFQKIKSDLNRRG